MNLAELARKSPILGDGAMGTMLQQRGLRIGLAPDVMNLEDPDQVVEVHRTYREAGSDYLETNTFGANRLKLAGQGLESKLQDIMARGVDLAREGAAGACLVAGSMGPTGCLLEPYGDTPREKVLNAFREAAELLDRAGVDFFLIETMTDINEASLAITAARETSERPIAATAVFAAGAKGFRTMMGTAAQEAAAAMIAAGAHVVGTNCCNGMAEAAGIMRAMAAGSPAALVAQPNAGLPRMESGRLIYPEGPTAMAAGVPRLLELGVRIIGGCCGTTPDHIRAMATALGR
ncbi:MAG: homocysteine S-methyltransferase family protein [bacterium]